MQTYIGTFEKKSGEMRTMHFVRMEDLPKGFLESKLKSTTGENKKTPVEGLEVVWDLDNKNFRFFNWNTAKNVEKQKVVDPTAVL